VNPGFGHHQGKFWKMAGAKYRGQKKATSRGRRRSER
jgi:hypothetical protein